MWTGEIRDWYIIQGEMTGRIYDSKNCIWAGWEYPEGTFISIHIYHFPDWNRLHHLPKDKEHEALNNFMRLTCCDQEGWYWDVKQVGTWNPCPLRFKLRVPEEVNEIYKFILKSGCMVSEYPYGYDLFRKENGHMTIIEDEDEDKDKVVSIPQLSIISGGRDNTGNWLLGLKEGSVFLCRHRKDEKEFILVQFHVKKKWSMAVWLHSNFPMHQAGDYFVHSLKFSQQHDLVDLQHDGEPDTLVQEEGDDNGFRG